MKKYHNNEMFCKKKVFTLLQSEMGSLDDETVSQSTKGSFSKDDVMRLWENRKSHWENRWRRNAPSHF